jgi:ABC-2 type transport system permease protein
MPVAFVALVLFMTALGFFLSAINVFFRDVQHLLEVFLLFWFWLIPIAYPINFALEGLAKVQVLGVKMSTIYMLNPMTNIVMGFQRAVYKYTVVTDSAGNQVKTLYQASLGAYFERLGVVILLSCALLWLCQRIFARAQGNFAQEI